MIFVTDSHAFLWYLANDERLGKNANKVFLKAEMGEAIIFIPTIALKEIMESHYVKTIW